MGGQGTAKPSDPQKQSTPTGPATGQHSQDTEDRVGPYGGDDGALEHERAEMEAPDTLTPEDTGSKVEPGRKAGR